MYPRVIGLLLTLRCNATCAHCCFHSSPARTDCMSEEEALSYVEQAARIPGIRGISVTGGEPFVEYELLHSVISTARQNGLRSRVVTNGYWAATPQRALKKLKRLVDAG